MLNFPAVKAIMCVLLISISHSPTISVQTGSESTDLKDMHYLCSRHTDSAVWVLCYRRCEAVTNSAKSSPGIASMFESHGRILPSSVPMRSRYCHAQHYFSLMMLLCLFFLSVALSTDVTKHEQPSFCSILLLTFLPFVLSHCI